MYKTCKTRYLQGIDYILGNQRGNELHPFENRKVKVSCYIAFHNVITIFKFI